MDYFNVFPLWAFKVFISQWSPHLSHQISSKISKCVLKMNRGLTGLERMTTFLGELSL